MRFDLPEPQPPRAYGGWIILIAIFSLMIGLELVQYLDRGKEPGSQRLEVFNRLRLAVETKEMVGALSSVKPANADDTLAKIEQELAKDSTKEAVAARFFSVARTEQGKGISEPVLSQLRKSKEPRDAFFAEIFSAKTLSPKRAKELETKLRGGGFISRLATVQAYEKAGDKTRREAMFPKEKSYVRIGVLSAALLFGTGGFVLLVLYGILKSQGLLPRKGFPLERISLADADRLALRCAQIFALFLGIQLAMPLVASALGKGVSKDGLTLATYLILIGAVLYIFKFPIGLKRFSLRDIGITKENLGKNIAWGFGAAMANLPLVLGAALLGQWIFAGLPKPEHPTTVQIQEGVSWFGISVIFFAASVGAPITEEIMFRGTLLPALARAWGKPVLAILAQGLLFAAIHPTGIPAWLPLATIGAMSGFLSRQTGSLVPSIVMHGVHNFGTLVIAKTILG
ncbi:MAG: CPBP family intramembrane metalloprotease [Chlorobia bacterium]|nr:CPBP family intramembrane metalloprotease [Fimbriimonadaceae bacterium]